MRRRQEEFQAKGRATRQFAGNVENMVRAGAIEAVGAASAVATVTAAAVIVDAAAEASRYIVVAGAVLEGGHGFFNAFNASRHGKCSW